MSTTINNEEFVDIAALVAELRSLPPRAALARETARLRRDELEGSLAIAGTPLDRTEIDALLDRGVTLGVHPIDAYLMVRDLGAAASFVYGQRPLAAGDPRPLLTVEDLRHLHAAASASRPQQRPGGWRLTVVTTSGGIVATPPWMVPFEVAAIVERVRRRPADTDVPAFLATALARLMRARPFETGNGRTARLAAALLLRRLDLPPAPLTRGSVRRYRAAVISAETGDPEPLRALIGEALAAACLRLIAAGAETPLRPLRELAGDGYAGLIKAAQRGRLRSVEVDGRILTTSAWIAAYRER